MDEAAKRRLVGAAVLVALAVIFVPMLVERDDTGLGEPILIPEAPEDEAWREDDPRALEPPADERLAEPEDLPMPLPTPEPPASEPDAEASQDWTSIPPPPERAEPAESPAAPARAEQRADASASAAADNSRDRSTSTPAGPKPVPAGARAWVIQVASLGSSEAARDLQDELRGKGYPAFIEQAEVGGRRYYRVRVGPEVERARADRLAEQLSADTGGQPLVQRYP
ncbi:SPOR domain-containing protein [Halochromatium salexigens]|nr:SPOR domain-containing protein [Halochromatium salexigens]